MNNLCTDIGFKSINHFGEQLCGDHVDIVEGENGSAVVVLADGLGSGVKASILSTLTAKIISTMLAEGLPLEECVSTIAATLPVNSEHGVAYSTFTVINIIENQRAEIIQYDNPEAIFIRGGKSQNYPKIEMEIEGKKILKSEIALEEGDLFVLMSDGCPHASPEKNYNFGWKREDIAEFMEVQSVIGYSAKTLATILVDECQKLYNDMPRDDATACVVTVRKRVPVNVLFGPPANRDDCERMMSLFFSKAGKHLVCGGTTASIAAKYLEKPLCPENSEEGSDVPPISRIEGVDLVTEGVVTLSRVLDYAKDYTDKNELYEKWKFKNNGAAQICRLLFEEATDISFFVGKAINPAHQNPELPVSFNLKMSLAEGLSERLEAMGKNVKVTYF